MNQPHSVPVARLSSSRAAWNAMDLQIGHAPASSRLDDNGALSARNVLLRQKLMERKRYDSADDAMKKAAAKARQSHSPPLNQGQQAFYHAMESKRQVQTNASALQGRNALIQRKLQPQNSLESFDVNMEAQEVSSPLASTARQQVMSPSRAGKYGALESKKKPSRQDKYGKLSAAHVLIRRKLKERKRFDSADYAMQKQGQQTDVPADVATSPAVSAQSIDHQVKHIKLSEEAKQPLNAAQAALAARAKRYGNLKPNFNPVVANAAQAALARYGIDKGVSPAAAARNVMLQRKLTERKMFDSADHFKKAAWE